MFTEQELKILKDFLAVFEKHGASEVRSQLLNLDHSETIKSLIGKSRGMHRGKWMRWTSDEDAIIMTKYVEYGANIPELLDHRTQNSIAIRAKRLGIQRQSWNK